jgi:hypothetical protein
MTSDLVQKLRTCSVEERKGIAMELAKLGTDEALQELINMVDTGVRVLHPKETRYRDVVEKLHWWNKNKIKQEPYEFDPSEHYDFEDQKIGIEALGETGRNDACKYLQSLLLREEKYTGLTCMAHREDTRQGNRVMDVSFPNAKGLLGAFMEHRRCYFCNEDDSPEVMGDSGYEAMKLILNTIEKLKSNVQNAQPNK